MQSKRPRPPTSARKKVKRRKGARKSPADPNQRLKPISLHPMEFDDVLRRLVGKQRSGHGSTEGER